MSAQTAVVVVAGHGQMGHAMEALLANRARLTVWDIAPTRLHLPPEVRQAASSADFLLLCVPTVAHQAVLGPLAGILPKACGALSIAKGLDDAGLCAAEILEKHLEARPWGVLGGPMIANELTGGRVGYAECGTAGMALYARVRELYPHDRLKLNHTPAPKAVSWCGVLKNVYAPLVGAADGLGLGDNVRGHLIMSATAEIQALLDRLAGRGASAYGDAGLADFATTVTSASSHHYALGRRVAAGDYADMECEGVHSLKVLQAAARVPAGKYPLYAVAAQLAEDPARLAPALHDWLKA
ncbi:MAG: hypothetical protein ACM3ZT_03165 [Bacillota bacterium]